MRVPESLLRRSVRLLNAINILHRQGYEKLGCSFWGGIDWFSWVAVVTSTDNMMVDREVGTTNLINERADSFLHEANREGNDYFGWTDARNASAEQLAELMKLRFSTLLDNCKGEHAENVAWLQRVIHQISITDKLPNAVFDETHALPDWTFLIGDREYVDYAPVCDVFRLGHQKYRFCAVNLNEHVDWHSAHRTIIDRIALDQVSELPLFPHNTHSVFEMGAYWEGAVYFIAKQLEVTSKEEFLLFLEGNKVRPVYGELFYRIYDSNGQLDYFVAYVVKQYLKSKPEYSGDLKDRWEKWLTYFEARNRYKHKSPQYMHKGGHLTDLYGDICDYCESLGDDVIRKELKLYTAFKRMKNFACVCVAPVKDPKITLWLKLSPSTVELEAGFTKDVSNIGHWGTGDLEVEVRTIEDVEKVKPLLKRSFDEN